MNHGYALITPGGKIVASTFNVEKDYAHSAAYDYLEARYRWPDAYWKKWDEFIAECKRRGWIVVPVWLST
jgi:hypothetical protein